VKYYIYKLEKKEKKQQQNFSHEATHVLLKGEIMTTGLAEHHLHQLSFMANPIYLCEKHRNIKNLAYLSVKYCDGD